MTGGEAAVKSLKKEKVEHVFGLIGSATMEMFDALYHEKNIKFNIIFRLFSSNYGIQICPSEYLTNRLIVSGV